MPSPLRNKLLSFLWRSENAGPVLLAITVGLLGGVGAILFRFLIDGAQWTFFTGGGRLADRFGLGADWQYVVVLPAIGLFLVSWMVRKWAPEARGHGVPEVMYSVKRQGGRIRPRVAGIKALASAICIGSGGSVGREGPIVQIGCTIGSSLGQALGLRETRVKLLVACGAAAGVAGTFNAPVAGVIFALEVILGSFAARSFGMVVISSVTATAVCQAALGSSPAFELAEVFKLQSPLELPIYMLLGLVAGVVALAFVRILYFFEDLFDRWTWHPGIKAILGGLAVGGLGYLSIRHFGGGYLFGVGYDGIEKTLDLGKSAGISLEVAGEMTLGVLLLLVLLKIIATSLTLAAGGSGGVFAPSLFIGAMVGGAFGLVVNAVFPGITAPPGAYALVGMGAVFAGAAHAPMTAILILFEMTDDYQIILPLMIAVVISQIVASWLFPDSIYTIKLRRRGGLTPRRTKSSVLDAILVADAMSSGFETVGPEEPVESLASRFHESHTRSAAVLDPEGDLLGIVTEFDVESALMSGGVTEMTAGEIMTRSLITCTPAQPLREVLEQFHSRDVGQFPVVDPESPGKVLGMLKRKELLWAYGEMATEHRQLMDAAGLRLGPDHRDAVQVELEVEERHKRLSFRKIRSIDVPDRCLIAVLRRAERAIVPRGETVVEPGDVLILLTTPDREARLRKWVSEVTKG